MRENRTDVISRAVECFEAGMGKRLTARLMEVPIPTVEKWYYTYRALGKEALLTRKHSSYSYELKIAAVEDFKKGMSRAEVMEKHGIKSVSPLRNWIKIFDEDGPEGLLPKKRGRKPKAGEQTFSSREEELEARVRDLELENEILKRIDALASEIEQKRHPR